jgi:signal transduction histidine kinase
MSARLERTEEQRRRLLADVSHELRTPLTVIQGNVEAMLDGLYPTDREHLGRIQSEAQHLERLIEDLRTLSMADAGALVLQREPMDLAQVAREVVDGFEANAAAAGVALSVTAASAAAIELDPRRVRQVIGNLVSNALRHTPRGGRVTVAVADSADQVTVAVTDTGSGMSAEDVGRAFDRFWRADDSAGAGLGLAIVRDLVKAHGGEAEIQSAPGRGTTVVCSFPRDAGAAQGSSATAR